MDISVIVPVYKGQKYIEPIQEMVVQNIEYANSKGKTLQVELIFVNDYPNETIEVCMTYKGYEIKVLVNEKNSGIHQTRVNGLNRAKGDYILFLDQDDEITQNCLYSQYMAIEDNDIVVGNGYRWINGQYRKIYRNTKKQRLTCKEKIFLKAANQIVSPGHCLIKKIAIPTAWCENIMKDNGGDDLFLWLLLFEGNRRFCINHECVYKHVDTGINLSSDLDAMYRSSDNLIKTAEKANVLGKNTLALYKRRIDYLKTMQRVSGIKKIMTMVSNIDICIAKLYAYYR